MEAVYLMFQALCTAVLVYGCYLSLKNWHLSDKEGIEREFRKGPHLQPGAGLQPPIDRYDPRPDEKAAA